MTSVVIVVPVLDRPHRIRDVMSNVKAATPSRHRLLFVASQGDDDEIAELRAAGADHIVVQAERGSWACKINDGVRASREPWVFTGADDLDFHPGWFERALSWATDSTCVIGTNDICNHRVMTGLHSTHSLFRRDYVERFGTIDQPGLVCHEGYGHAYADDEAVLTAKARGVYVHAFDSIVEHLHPLVSKSPDDETYRIGRKASAAGSRLLAQRRKLWSDEGWVRASMVAPPERAVVVTATYGGYDADLHVPVQQDIPTRFVCVSDHDFDAPPPWQVVVAEPRWPDDPRMSAKVPKMLPDVGCDDVVWIDASHEIVSARFVREALMSRNDGIAAFAHPRRRCIYAEIQALLGPERQGGLYADRPLRQQSMHYRAERYPTGAGLYACGTLAWDLRHPKAREFGAAWLEETSRWSHQDQVEFPVVARRLGITPGVFRIKQIDPVLSRGHPYLANGWLRIHPHTRADIAV